MHLLGVTVRRITVLVATVSSATMRRASDFCPRLPLAFMELYILYSFGRILWRPRLKEIPVLEDQNVKYDLDLAEELAKAKLADQACKVTATLLGLCSVFSSELMKDKVKARKAVIFELNRLGNAIEKEMLMLKLPKCIQKRAADALKMKWNKCDTVTFIVLVHVQIRYIYCTCACACADLAHGFAV